MTVFFAAVAVLWFVGLVLVVAGWCENRADRARDTETAEILRRRYKREFHGRAL